MDLTLLFMLNLLPHYVYSARQIKTFSALIIGSKFVIVQKNDIEYIFKDIT